MSTSKHTPRAGQINRDLIEGLSQTEIDRRAEMARRELGISDGGRYERADLKPKPRMIREELGHSQQEFANRFGLSVKTIRHWEQGRTLPDRSAVILLKTIEIAPEVVEHAVLALIQTVPKIQLRLSLPENSASLERYEAFNPESSSTVIAGANTSRYADAA